MLFFAKKERILFLIIFVLAAFFRLYGTNWDQGQHLHPDERFLTMVTQTIEWPKTISQYFDAPSSPLNPHNKGFSFFVYGLFPLLFVKFIAEHFNLADYANLTLVGRQLSGLVDLGTTILVFLVAKEITQSEISKKIHSIYYLLFTSAFPFLAMFFYAVSILPIQLSHFYATDPYITFFITLTFYLGIKLLHKRELKLVVLMGISFGLALGSKISSALFAPIPVLFIFFSTINRYLKNTSQIKKLEIKLIPLKTIFAILVSCIISGILFSIFSYLFLRVSSPYTFATSNIFNITLNPKVVNNWKELKAFDGVDTAFPPALQWIPTKPYIYPFIHLLFWGLGLPIGIVSISSILFFTLNFGCLISKRKFSFLFFDAEYIILHIALLWTLALFIYQAGQFAKALRYLYSFMPFSPLLAAFFLVSIYEKCSNRQKRYGRWIGGFLLAVALVWSLGFMTIYTRNHSRVSASKWIYNTVPPGSTVSNEIWDDPQPLNIVGGDSSQYKGTMLSIYDPDNREKWDKILTALSTTDYIFLTSNRLWRSLTAIPYKYPYTAKYYQLLFSGKLGYEPIAAFTSYPCLLPKNLETDIKPDKDSTNLKPPPFSITSTSYCYLALNDDGAEESFTVYDHPKVVIFQKKRYFTTDELKNILFSSVYASQKK